MRASTNILSGTFFGGDIEPGTFHKIAAAPDAGRICENAKPDAELPRCLFHSYFDEAPETGSAVVEAQPGRDRQPETNRVGSADHRLPAA